MDKIIIAYNVDGIDEIARRKEVMNIQEEFRKTGYAPGDYFVSCHRCGKQFTGDKRASCCFDCAVEHISNLAKPEASHAVLAEGWRDAKKELPDGHERFIGSRRMVNPIIVYNGVYVTVGTYRKYPGRESGTFTYLNNKWEIEPKVTHWRPLPDPPAFV